LPLCKRKRWEYEIGYNDITKTAPTLRTNMKKRWKEFKQEKLDTPCIRFPC
jgi:hypothetical protein